MRDCSWDRQHGDHESLEEELLNRAVDHVE
jgi:hypothetical protein